MKTWQKLKQNPSLWERYFIREKVINAVRQYFQKEKFHEVEVPLLLSHPLAESYLEIFETTLLDRYRKPTKAYLSTSPEVFLKKLLVAGIGDCYSLTKSFRNMETQSNTHNPEFTILEWYRLGVPYENIMEDCENLFRHIHQSLHDHTDPSNRYIRYMGKDINIYEPWERLTVKQAFKTWADIDFDNFLHADSARQIAKEKGYNVEPSTTWEELYNQIFLNEIEPHLGQTRPTILYEFPGSMGALAKKKSSDPRFAERFEFYIAGLELGDCYSELANPEEQDRRFQQELKEIHRMGKTSYDYDHDFIDALKTGLPDCSGIAIGLDRVVMLFSDVTDIADTLFFPGKELFEDEA